MNCGIHDAYALGNAIAKALSGDAPAIATDAAQQRRQIAQDQLLPRTDRTIAGGTDWLEHVRGMAADPAQAREMLVRAAMLDMAPPRRHSRDQQEAAQ